MTKICAGPRGAWQGLPKVKMTCCGMRHCNGRAALAYARCRHIEQGCKDGDIGRARRQQKVIFGIREKSVRPGEFSQTAGTGAKTVQNFSAGIHTNMSLRDALQLAVLARDIPKKNIRNAVIDNTMLIIGNRCLGGQNASIVKPIPDKIRVLRDEIFSSSAPLGPIAQGNPTSLMQGGGGMSVRVLNGTSTSNCPGGLSYIYSGRECG